MARSENLLVVSSSGADKLNPMLEAFRSLGTIEVEAVHYGETHKFHNNGFAGLAARAANRLLRLIRDIGYNRSILDAASLIQPDYVFVIKGLRVYPRTLDVLKHRFPQTQLIIWSQDDMFAAHNRSSYFTGGLPRYDLVVTQKSYNAEPEELPTLGAQNILFQNKAFLPRIHRIYAPEEVDAPAHDVLFIGTAERERFEMMNHAARAGVEIHIYGSGWDVPWVAMNADRNLKIHNENLLGERYAAAISRSRISLGFLRKKNRDLQTSRTIEIPASGGFMLTEDTEEQRRLFEADREAVYFSDAASLAALLQKYLADESARRTIAEAGYARSRASDYTYQTRAKEILETARCQRETGLETRASSAVRAADGQDAATR